MKYKFPLHSGRMCAALVVLGMALSGTTQLSAADKTWLGTTNAWGTASNWDPVNKPSSSDNAIFNDAATVKSLSIGGELIGTMTFNGTSDYLFTAVGSIAIGTGIQQNSSGAITFNKLTSGLTNRVIQGAGSGIITISESFSGAGSFAVRGSTQVYFNGVQTSTGTPDFSVGNPGATLGGSGTFNSRVVVASGVGLGGAHIAPGTPTTIGTLVLAGGFSAANATNTTNFDFTLGGAGNTSDKISITGGTITLNNPTGKYVLNIGNQGLGATAGVFELINWTGATEAFTGTSDTSFAFGTLPVGWVVDTSYGTNGIDFDTTANTLSVKFGTIPEPTTALLTGLGLGFILTRIRRRRA